MSVFANYDEIMERLSLGKLWNFPGGVHPQQRKELSNQHEIQYLPLPDKLYIPVKQHIGVNGEIIVSVGDKVLKGQPLTRCDSAFSVPVHASSSGVVSAITEHPAPHPSGLPELTICIDVDGFDDEFETQGISQYAKADKSTVIGAICDAGISGLGGAGFPTHIKTNNVKPVEFLIINGIECEPYISADDRIMREHAWQIRQGIDILRHLIKPKQVIIAIEDNKPEALETMSLACQQQSDYQVISVPTKYPAGGEKQLIQVLTSREVPSDGLPIDVGCMMYNVGTCFAIADAVIEGKALTERVVTVTGKAFNQPQNVWARIGTPISHILEYCEFDREKQTQPRIIMGGPMMGFTLASASIPIVKITNCILAPSKDELPDVDAERGCIRCSACADACPASLLPQQLFWYSKAKDYDVAQEYNLFDCIECGACAYVCPSEIPLVHYYRQAKSDIRQQLHEKEQAEKARIRFEARKERLAKEKHEREEKHRLAAEARNKTMQKDGGSAKDKIAAALARAKAKKAALNKTDGNTLAQDETKSDSTKTASVKTASTNEAAESHTPVAKTSATKGDATPANTPKTKAGSATKIDDTKQDKANSDVDSKEDLKKQRVAAAIARAKAKKKAAANAPKPKRKNEDKKEVNDDE